MIKPLLTLIIISIASMTIAQEVDTPSDSIPFEIQKQAFIYTLAKQYNDPVIVRSALYNLIAMDPSNVALRDSLALIYFQYGQYASAAIITQDVLAVYPNDQLATEIAAISFENIGVKDKAVKYYEAMYLQNNDLTTLYKIAFIQYELKRFNEAITSSDIIINDTEADEIKLYFTKSDSQNQEILLKAAVYRLKGLISNAKGNIDQAKDYYRSSLQLVPEFEIAAIEYNQIK